MSTNAKEASPNLGENSVTDAAPEAASMVISYQKSTTSIIYGLPLYEQYQVLHVYCVCFTAESGTNSERPVATYDLCCQYYCNLHAIEEAGSHTESDDSIFESDNAHAQMPTLGPLAPSPAGSASSDNASQVVVLTIANTSTTTVPDMTSTSSPVHGGFAPASQIWAAGNADGEGVERYWLPEPPHSSHCMGHVMWIATARTESIQSNLVPLESCLLAVCGNQTTCQPNGITAPRAAHRIACTIEYKSRPGDTSQDMALYISADGKHVVWEGINVTVKKRKISPSDLDDTYKDWVPLPGDWESGDGEDGGEEPLSSGEKRKRYKSSDDAMNLWRPLIQRYLDKLIRREGLGDDSKTCCCCGATFTHKQRRFRCLNCGEFAQCLQYTEYIHTVKYKYCGCDRSDHAANLEQLLRHWWYPATTVDPATCVIFAVLDLFRLLNVIRNISAHDFVGTLERKTNASQMHSVPDRYKAFGRMARQYAFLKRLKHTGRAHDPLGVNNTKNGECTVMCWHVDLPLGDGWVYMVEEGPYREPLKGYVTEKDIKRHPPYDRLEMFWSRWRRIYANMDYILLLAVIGVTVIYLAISYDIACQWQVNLEKRIEVLPARLRLDLTMVTMIFSLPVWHAVAHKRECQVQNSLSYIPGERRTDGEGIERTRGHLNPLGWSMKEMNVGAHHDAVEDKVDHLHFEKNVNQGCADNRFTETTLRWKLILAIDERDRQVAAFTQVDSTSKKPLKKWWQQQIDEWRADRAKPNPYKVADSNEGPRVAAIRLALAQDEAQEAAMGGTKLHGASVISFLTAGLQLEEMQRRIRDEVNGRSLLAADKSEKIAEMRISFFSKLAKFRKLQAVHMAAAVKELAEDEDARDSEMPPLKAEDVKLYLPSGLRTPDREEGCRKGLRAMEARLCEGQCRDALVHLRSRLHAKRHLLNHRDLWAVVGQRAATRSQTLIAQIGERVDAAAAKYGRTRLALIALRGEAGKRFRELKGADVQLDEEREIDVCARKKLGTIGKRRREGPALSSKDMYMSWIWTDGGGLGENEKDLHESVRVEWSRAKARKERWEEVQLLREEMKRVLQFLRWRGAWWEARRATRREGVSAELWAGLDLSRRFKSAWDTLAAMALRMAVAEDALFMECVSPYGEDMGGDAEAEVESQHENEHV
ncbi:hypothetical protein C8R45DRAFT_934146 [Mycena sanguinolenta]|nr:hypothetical protein C8R45DRAFT_934146 [Mycena sanguinolenta]